MAKCTSCNGKGSLPYGTGGYEVCERCRGCGFEPDADAPVVVGVETVTAGIVRPDALSAKVGGPVLDENFSATGGIPTREEAAVAVCKHQMDEFIKSHGCDPAQPGGDKTVLTEVDYNPATGVTSVRFPQSPADPRRYSSPADLFGDDHGLGVERGVADKKVAADARAYVREAAKRWWEESHPKSPRGERRLAVLWVNESTVLDVCVREGLDKPRFVVRGEWPGLPADVRVHEVRHEWSRKQFGFVLSSASFPPVPDYAQIPDVPERLNMRYNYVVVGPRPAAYYPDAVKKEMRSAFRDKPVGWAVSSGDRHLATFALEELADEYLNFIKGPGR